MTVGLKQDMYKRSLEHLLVLQRNELLKQTNKQENKQTKTLSDERYAKEIRSQVKELTKMGYFEK